MPAPPGFRHSDRFSTARDNPLSKDQSIDPGLTIGSRMDRLASITAFVRVVENGGFTAAARHLNLSPTMVSNHNRDPGRLAVANKSAVRLLLLRQGRP
jgi:Bacterial regulatory helix-turn-helix protein, lysR family